MVPFENWAYDLSASEKKRISSESPVFRITVTKINGDKAYLTLWERFTEGKKDTDRLWGKLGDSEDFFILRYFDIDPILKKITYFFPE
jgi:hypothetical protein